MSELYPNIYQRARKVTLLTQEEAAKRLDIAPETLKRYEGGKIVPPDEVVARMIEVYRADWLALEHRRATDRLGVLPEVELRPLTQSVISLVNRIRGVYDQLGKLLEIAEDGRIDESEEDDFADVKSLIAENVAAELALLYAPEDGAKKERPEAGTSKRSASQGKHPENHCKAILPQKATHVNTYRRGEVRA